MFSSKKKQKSIKITLNFTVKRTLAPTETTKNKPWLQKTLIVNYLFNSIHNYEKSFNIQCGLIK